jgi:hypothetical protein
LEKSSCGKKFCMLPPLLRLENEDGYQQVSSPIGNYAEGLQNKIKTLFSLPFNTSVRLGEEPLLWIICSAWQLDSKVKSLRKAGLLCS